MPDTWAYAYYAFNYSNYFRNLFLTKNHPFSVNLYIIVYNYNILLIKHTTFITFLQHMLSRTQEIFDYGIKFSLYGENFAVAFLTNCQTILESLKITLH